MKKNTIKKRTSKSKLRQVKTYGYRPPSPSRKQMSGNTKEEKNITFTNQTDRLK